MIVCWFALEIECLHPLHRMVYLCFQHIASVSFGCVTCCRTPTKAILLSAYVKILMHTQPLDQELQVQVEEVFKRCDNVVDAEVQQRAVEYMTLSRKGSSMVDIMAEMPKFPERQSALIKKAEDTEGESTEMSATKLRQQQNSMALVVADPGPANGGLPPPSVSKASSTSHYSTVWHLV
jgi:AP-2 complex subunit alpha